MIFETPLGQIHGIQENGLIKLFGIPYAKADRFKLPTMIEKLESPYYATQPSGASPQKRDSYFTTIFGRDALEGINIKENSLNLSITRPAAIANGSNLPVMVWIHGGGYTSGTGDSPGFNPSAMVQENAVIVVNISYRLGILGFLGGYRDIPANLGLIDIITALKWLHQYISFFGGDAKNVTLFGQSAGGDAILHLLAAQGIEGLFHKAILQSASFGLRPHKMALTEKMIEIGKNADLTTDTDGLLMVQDKMLKSAQGFGLQSGMPFGVQYGYYPLPKEEAIESVWQDRAADYEILVGYNTDETSIFVPIMKDLNKYTQFPLVGSLLNRIIIKYTTYKVYKQGALAFYRFMKKAGGSIALYECSFGSFTNKLKATHTVELPLLFWDDYFWNQTLLIKDLSHTYVLETGKKFRQVWATFATRGVDSIPASFQGMKFTKDS